MFYFDKHDDRVLTLISAPAFSRPFIPETNR